MDVNVRLKLVCCFLIFISLPEIEGNKPIEANPDAKRLYDDLLSNYNRLIRPVANNTDKLTVWLGLKLAQLTEVNLRSQVVTASIWVVQRWHDYKLRWNPAEYGGLERIYVPSELIWLPDIVLFNNADGNFEVTLMTKATLYYNGEVTWVPPAIYKSSCEMNVLYFPFDEQQCILKFGSWTYNGLQVDLKHIDQRPDSPNVPIAIDLSDFIMSVEWDVLDVPATKNEEFYPCCDEPYSDITFTVVMRRKTLFYTVNLIIPLVGITFLTVLVFYLPSDSGEKVTLCSSILVSLTVFFLLLAEIIPPTSLAIPLLGKYLLFTMTLVTLSICVTVCVLNVHFRSPATHKMSPWVRKVFLDLMPHCLFMTRPPYSPEALYSDKYLNDGTQYICDDPRESFSETYGVGVEQKASSPRELNVNYEVYKSSCSRDTHRNYDTDNVIPRRMSPDVLSALQGVRFIAQQIKNTDKEIENLAYQCRPAGSSSCSTQSSNGRQLVNYYNFDIALMKNRQADIDQFQSQNENMNTIEDWKYVSMVLDRFFLWVFTIACVVGTCMIIFQAPSLYDHRLPLDQMNISTRRNFTLSPLPSNFETYPVEEDTNEFNGGATV